ncbi:hypothetical protein SAMN04488693_11928 [Arthrobacter subterraneus]|uniref:Uncharacterized protein n=1 Tax=Arthrobacter subterraneus TaxID=335973 RepID=A0A1G8MR77_9MICC|nr:hypothetical protein SAMN04488693_11928 [Arthrobacter subterraneus]
MNQSQNAWIAAAAPAVAQVAAEPVVLPQPPLTGAALPQKGIPEPEAADRLPRRYVTGSAALWIVGVHGGAGESAVARLIDGSRPTQHAWPVIENSGMPPRVLLVCRSNMNGLESARRALIEWTSPQPPHVELMGLAVLADAPGKLPKPLRDLATIVGGGAPRLWHLPWVEAWRTGDAEADQLPRDTRKFITDINSLLS